MKTGIIMPKDLIPTEYIESIPKKYRGMTSYFEGYEKDNESGVHKVNIEGFDDLNWRIDGGDGKPYVTKDEILEFDKNTYKGGDAIEKRFALSGRGYTHFVPDYEFFIKHSINYFVNYAKKYSQIHNTEYSFMLYQLALAIKKVVKKIEEVVEQIKLDSRRYAKRQYTFFNNQLDVKWFNVDFKNFNKTIEEVHKYIERSENE